jgi:hypothetical protein
MAIDFLTPEAALVGAAVVAPLAAWAIGERRAARARATLRLPAPAGRSWWVPAALAATLGLLALAAAQPVVSAAAGHARERTGEVFVVVDTSESMRAGSPTRFSRAVDAAERIGAALDGVRVGLASDTDRVLPHLFPTADQADFRTTLRRAIGVDRPPPGRRYREATGFDALSALATAKFFKGPGPRVVVLLTDGESRSFSAQALARAYARHHLRLVIVRFWGLGDRIAGDPGYTADPSSAAEDDALARALGTQIYGEREVDDAIREVERALGPSRPVPAPKGASTARPLAPYAMLAALLPLGLLVWRRNIV